MNAHYYIMVPSILLSMYLLPALWLVLGWALMEGAAMNKPVRARQHVCFPTN